MNNAGFYWQPVDKEKKRDTYLQKCVWIPFWMIWPLVIEENVKRRYLKLVQLILTIFYYNDYIIANLSILHMVYVDLKYWNSSSSQLVILMLIKNLKVSKSNYCSSILLEISISFRVLNASWLNIPYNDNNILLLIIFF